MNAINFVIVVDETLNSTLTLRRYRYIELSELSGQDSLGIKRARQVS